MSEVLDQSEIDALLNAVESDAQTVGLEPESDSTGAPASTTLAEPPAKAITYDFKRPERVSKDQIRAISSIHEVFARNFGATLSGFLRTITDVRVIGVEQLTYNEFIQSLPNPTCFLTLEGAPLEGQMCLEISPLIVYPIVDRMLGGANHGMFIPQRPLTSIEWGLMNRIVDRALVHLSEEWQNLVEAEFKVVNTESNPQLVHIVAPTEVVIFITFEIKIGQHVGTMSLCMPFNTIESVLSRLTSQSWFYKPKKTTENQRKRLVRNLHKSTVPIVAHLASTRIRLSQLNSLRAGDVIEFDKRAEADLILKINGVNKFAAQMGQVRGYKAMRLVRRAERDEII